jgi:PAS domain S-box-containing protein
VCDTELSVPSRPDGIKTELTFKLEAQAGATCPVKRLAACHRDSHAVPVPLSPFHCGRRHLQHLRFASNFASKIAELNYQFNTKIKLSVQTGAGFSPSRLCPLPVSARATAKDPTMRLNLPVSDTEITLSDSETIVSTTDLQGNITYANPYFIAVSGYSAEELIGAPQNILRHPDMPVEAFADFWATIRSGRSWSGMVKNRCKNGDYYWVLANVTPVVEDGVAVGYMSVRTKPTRQQVAQAAALYARIQAGQADGMAIRQGAAVRTGWTAKLLGLRDLPLGKRIGWNLGLLTAVLLLQLAWNGACCRPRSTAG